jgi:hypothetical protein
MIATTATTTTTTTTTTDSKTAMIGRARGRAHPFFRITMTDRLVGLFSVRSSVDDVASVRLSFFFPPPLRSSNINSSGGRNDDNDCSGCHYHHHQ